MFVQRPHRADRDQVGPGKDRVELHAARDQAARCLITRLLGRQRIDMQAGVDRVAGFAQHVGQAGITVAKFGIMARCVAQKGDPATSARDQMGARVAPAAPIVAADRHPQRMLVDRPPAHEMRALRHQLLQPGAIDFIVAIAQQDDAVGLATILIIDMPVGRQLLETGQQIIAALGACLQDRPQHRQEEGVDPAFVGQQILEEQKGQRVALAPPQRGCILVHRVIELPGDRLDPQPRRLAHRLVAAQRARHGRLGHAGQRGDVEGCHFVVGGHGATLRQRVSIGNRRV